MPTNAFQAPLDLGAYAQPIMRRRVSTTIRADAPELFQSQHARLRAFRRHLQNDLRVSRRTKFETNLPERRETLPGRRVRPAVAQGSSWRRLRRTVYRQSK